MDKSLGIIQEKLKSWIMKHKQLTYEQRYAIAHMLKEKHSKKSIIKTLCLVESTFLQGAQSAIVKRRIIMLNTLKCYQKREKKQDIIKPILQSRCRK